jgi:hypothetical protein
VNDSIFREVNLRIYSIAGSSGIRTDYICECGYVTCRAVLLELSQEDFAEVLAMRGSLLLAPGHETPGTEVVFRTGRYLVVRPTSPAGGHARAATLSDGAERVHGRLRRAPVAS